MGASCPSRPCTRFGWSPVGPTTGRTLEIGVALGTGVVVEKRRHLYLVGQTRIHLDEVTGLGTFMELEVVLRDDQSPADGERIAQELMKALEVDTADLIHGAYADLIDARNAR